jgi:hypothetical protein
MSGEFESWVFAKKWIVWIIRVWISCWEGWEGFEPTFSNVGNILSKKLDKFYFVYAICVFPFAAALPMT